VNKSVGRNDPCPCGSGKKFKKCCGAQNTQRTPLEKNNAVSTLLATAVQTHRSGNIAAARQYYQQVLQQDPKNDNALNLLGVIANQQGDHDNAIQLISRAVGIDPKAPEFHYNLAKAYQDNGNLASAVEHYQTALKLQPALVDAHVNLGLILFKNEDFKNALTHFLSAEQLQPDNADIQYSLGQTYLKLSSIENAALHLNRSLALHPNFDTLIELGNVQYCQGEPLKAIECFKDALGISQGFEQTARAVSNILLMLNYTTSYTPEQIYQQHVEYTLKISEPLRRYITSHNNNPDPARKLRIGYVSPDFLAHSVANFVLAFLQHHDPKQVEIFGYHNHHISDSVTQRIKQLCHHWRDIADLDDTVVADRISQDKIDILVDLAGHTNNTRIPLFARKPAPIQVSWIGYPNTTGLNTMDYRITDTYADPVGQTEQYHSETLVRLPESFSCYSAPDNAPAVNATPALHNKFVTFGTFNQIAKLSPASIKTWSHILLAVPQSRFILKTAVLKEQSIKQRLLQDFHTQGIDNNRITLLPSDASSAAHLEKYHQLDIALDTFPYNGTTTTCEALWMGIPVIVMDGNTHVSRVGVSQMNNIGLPELIAKSEQDYVRIAVELASDIDRLQSLRAGMRERMLASPLMDAARLTRHLESVYRDIWQQWCQQQA